MASPAGSQHSACSARSAGSARQHEHIGVKNTFVDVPDGGSPLSELDVKSLSCPAALLDSVELLTAEHHSEHHEEQLRSLAMAARAFSCGAVTRKMLEATGHLDPQGAFADSAKDTTPRDPDGDSTTPPSDAVSTGGAQSSRSVADSLAAESGEDDAESSDADRSGRTGEQQQGSSSSRSRALSANSAAESSCASLPETEYDWPISPQAPRAVEVADTSAWQQSIKPSPSLSLRGRMAPAPLGGPSFGSAGCHTAQALATTPVSSLQSNPWRNTTAAAAAVASRRSYNNSAAAAAVAAPLLRPGPPRQPAPALPAHNLPPAPVAPPQSPQKKGPLPSPSSQHSQPSQDRTLQTPPLATISWYRVAYLGGIQLRSAASVDAPRTGQTLVCNEVFAVAEEVRGTDARIYLRLSDGRGWVFDDAALIPQDPSVIRGHWAATPAPTPTATPTALPMATLAAPGTPLASTPLAAPRPVLANTALAMMPPAAMVQQQLSATSSAGICQAEPAALGEQHKRRRRKRGGVRRRPKHRGVATLQDDGTEESVDTADSDAELAEEGGDSAAAESQGDI